MPIAESSGNQTADATLKSTSGILYGVQLNAAGDIATIALYDGTSASGVKLMELEVAINSFNYISIPGGISFATGLYADVTGSTPVYVAWYS